MRWIVPIPGFTDSWVIGFAVDGLGYYGWVVPWLAFFVWFLIVVEFVDEVEEPCWFVADDFEAVPVFSWNPDYLKVASSRYIMGQVLGELQPCWACSTAALPMSVWST